MQRLIIANLDCEQDHGNPRAPRRLPAPVMRRISAAGTLLAVFGRPGDTLWTPEPVAPARLAGRRVADLRVVSGPLAAQARPDALLCWGETRATWALGPARPGPAPELENWPDALWQLRAAPEIARRCNDRRYCLEIARELGTALPGAAVLRSVNELVEHLGQGGNEHGHDGAWVLEAPFSASGRLRLRRRGRFLDQAALSRAGRLFAAFGELVFQPWVDRVLDAACLGVIAGPERWRVLPPHGLDIDHAGVFRGITVGPPERWAAPDMAEVAADAALRARDMAAEVARRLARDGYRGAFGIDGFVFRDHRGQLRVHAMCEINARLSFGFVAHALARVHDLSQLRLRLGGDAPPAASPRIIPLLGPGQGDATSAWLELNPS
jgi:hypothetical protein